MDRLKVNIIIQSLMLGILMLSASIDSEARTMPQNMSVSDNGRELMLEAKAPNDLYDINEVKVIELQFNQSDWWELLEANYETSTDIPANLIYNGTTYPNVGVRFRGQTSYKNIHDSQKKSFNISIDYEDEELRLDGYKTLNLNNCYTDATFMKEILYSRMAGKYVPMFKANFVKLIINGENWGIYSNVQQLNREFYSDWFLSNDGTNWRAIIPDTTTLPKGPSGFVGFGTGFSSLNYLGDNPIRYTRYYTLKSHKVENPWDDLVTTCQKLEQLPSNLMYDSLQYFIDVDRALWHLAIENIFTDDDSYINKGGMDYYIYYDIETNRINPIIYDGNSTFMMKNVNLSLFSKEGDTKYPLINKLFANPQLKQRYIAHVRTILNEIFTLENVDSLILFYNSMIEDEVIADNKKIYSNVQYKQRINELKRFVTDRRNVLMGNGMVLSHPPTISAVNYISNEGLNQAPKIDGKVNVTANVSSGFGVFKVYLYYGTGLMGVFDKVEMFDDGTHNDGTAGDGVYGAEIPSFPSGTYVRYYIEALADNNFKTTAYSPEGAEHSVFYYQVQSATQSDSPIVINEFMASNNTIIADPQGDFDDWIEIYNKSDFDVNLSGMYLSDKLDNLKKWQFPENIVLKTGEYLIVWADENGKATPGLHANFKLSADGEVILLVNNDENGNSIMDSISFGSQETDISYGRFPNGTGDFSNMQATPGAINQAPMSVEDINSPLEMILIYPNPASDYIEISRNINHMLKSGVEAVLEIKIFNTLGECVITTPPLQDTPSAKGNLRIDISFLPCGVYYVRTGNLTRMFVKM
ncbi:MAG: CotH kinase family protein [Desulfobulbaceae bacterium]|nr:CotH kinase family protein [Desulfobulbaceae bacterium]